jgi:hypothetical protein
VPFGKGNEKLNYAGSLPLESLDAKRWPGMPDKLWRFGKIPALLPIYRPMPENLIPINQNAEGWGIP